MRKKYTYLFVITLLYFLLGFINILSSLLALVCLLLPFLLILVTRRKTWCISYCPRSYWLDVVGRLGRRRTPPAWLVSRRIKRGVLIYFGMNFFFIMMSSIMVAVGRLSPIDSIRLFIVIATNWQLPQLVDIGSIPPVLMHLSYRFYSVMLSSTLIGSLLAVLYRPRTWCAVCPINSLSNGLVSYLSGNER